jgi:carboxypeptidase family protein
MKPPQAALLFVYFGLAISVAHAQGVGSSGTITGTVIDPAGAFVPKADIVAVDAGRGMRFIAVTDTSGEYRLTALPPAVYDVTVKTSGFQTEVRKGVVLTIGAAVAVDFHLKLASAIEVVEVSAEPPVVETERGSQANTVTQQYISDLPIDRRDYLTFTLLLPGVSTPLGWPTIRTSE